MPSSLLKEQEKCPGMHFSPPTGRDLMSDEYRIQELLERDVYVGETRVGVTVSYTHLTQPTTPYE